MTTKQTALYWRSWGETRRYLLAFCDYTPTEVDTFRRDLHAKALGVEKSSKDFTNADLDKVLAEFRAISRPADFSGQMRQQNMPRARLIFSIERLQLPDAYLNDLAAKIHGHHDWRQLPDSDLSKFRFTATSRARARAKKPATAKP